MRRRVPNNTKSRELVGFDPATTLDQIITKVAGFQRSASTVGDADLADQLLAG
jgi:UDP-glucose 4-epimerase